MSLHIVPMPTLDERIAAGLTPGDANFYRSMRVGDLAYLAENCKTQVAEAEAELACVRRKSTALDAMLIKKMAAEGVLSVAVDGVVLTPFESGSGLLRTPPGSPTDDARGDRE